MPQLSRRFSTASLYHPTKLPKQQVCTCTPSKQSQHKRYRKTSHSQHTGQHSVGFHRRTSRIPAQPSAPTADIIVRSVFHGRNSSTKSQKKNCHQTCRSRHSANLRTNYVAARSQQCVRLLLPLVGATAVHLLKKKS